MNKSDVRLIPSHKSILGFCENSQSKMLTLAPNLGFPMFDILRNFQHDPQHLFILSDDKIEIGDWVFCNWSITKVYKLKDIHDGYFIDDNGYYHPSKSHGIFFVRKITFTTDETLGLPEVPKDFLMAFIEEYNKGSLIKEATVETFNIIPESLNPVANQIALYSIHNTDEVTKITSTKFPWNKEQRELIEKIVRQYAFEKHNMVHINDPWLNQWFQENI